MGSVRPLADQTDEAGVWSVLFSVERDRKMRGCIDLTTINPYLQYVYLKMERSAHGTGGPSPVELHVEGGHVILLHASADRE